MNDKQQQSKRMHSHQDLVNPQGPIESSCLEASEHPLVEELDFN